MISEVMNERINQNIDSFLEELTKIDNFKIIKAGLEYYFIRVKEYNLFIKGTFEVDSDNGLFRVKDIIELDITNNNIQGVIINSDNLILTNNQTDEIPESNYNVYTETKEIIYLK